METTANKNVSTLLQLSTFTQYFFPLGNFIFPAIIWGAKRHDSEFVDYNGKQVINFQLSLLVYSLTLLIITIPTAIYCVLNNIDVDFSWNEGWEVSEFTAKNLGGMLVFGIVTTFLFFILKVAEFFLIIYASVKNSNGQKYDFPLTIKFIK